MIYSHFVQIILSNKYEERSKDCKNEGWQVKKFLGVRWSKKTKINLETVNFGEISVQYI